MTVFPLRPLVFTEGHVQVCPCLERVCVLADFPVLHIRTLRMFQYQLLNWLPFIGREGEGGGIVSH